MGEERSRPLKNPCILLEAGIYVYRDEPFSDLIGGREKERDRRQERKKEGRKDSSGGINVSGLTQESRGSEKTILQSAGPGCVGAGRRERDFAPRTRQN